MATAQMPQEYEQEMANNPPRGLLTRDKVENFDVEGVYVNHECASQALNKLPWIFCVIGPSGAGKDTIVKPALDSGIVHKAKTATTRERRTNEAEDAYIWIRANIKEGESLENFISRVEAEEGIKLIEYDEHNGHIYGLPESSLIEAANKGPVLVVTESIGVQTLREKLGDKYNIVSIFILPENYEQVWERNQGRGNETERFKEAIEYIKEAPKIANYFILNKEYRDPRVGIENSQESLSGLVAGLTQGKFSK